MSFLAALFFGKTETLTSLSDLFFYLWFVFVLHAVICKQMFGSVRDMFKVFSNAIFWLEVYVTDLWKSLLVARCLTQTLIKDQWRNTLPKIELEIYQYLEVCTFQPAKYPVSWTMAELKLAIEILLCFQMNLGWNKIHLSIKKMRYYFFIPFQHLHK